jgi:hypothetical protein
MISPDVPFDQLAERHLHELVESGVREGRRIEFKAALPGGGDDAKREFLADVSSFANAGGGDLIFGIRDEEGIAIEVTHLEGDADAAIRRWEGVLETGIEPRLLGVRTRPVAVAGGWALVVRIPASWTGPHAVKSSRRGVYRFYSRNSAGKYPLDVGEIRSSFLAADSATRRVRAWQAERLGRIIAGETPVRLREAPTLVMHLVPLALDLAVEPGAVEGSGILRALALDYCDIRWNIDGLLAYAPLDANQHSPGYAQLYRDGHFETTNAVVLEWVHPSSTWSPGVMDGIQLEHVLMDAPANPLRALEIAGAQPPFAVLVALLGVRGMEVVQAHVVPRPLSEPIDRDPLLLPEVLCETFEWDRRRGMRPVIDALWQSSGSRGSPSYTSAGDWKPLN